MVEHIVQQLFPQALASLFLMMPSEIFPTEYCGGLSALVMFLFVTHPQGRYMLLNQSAFRVHEYDYGSVFCSIT